MVILFVVVLQSKLKFCTKDSIFRLVYINCYLFRVNLGSVDETVKMEFPEYQVKQETWVHKGLLAPEEHQVLFHRLTNRIFLLSI